MTGEPLTLLTFAPMIDSEFARLVLRRHGVPYRERDHLFGWVSLKTIRRGGYGRIPILYGRGVRLTGPRRIAAHFDRIAAPEHRLSPDEEPLRSQALADADRFNGQLAVDVAVFAYHHLLPERALMTPVFAGPLPPREARLTPHLYPAVSLLLKGLLRLGPRRAEDALGRIRATFDAVDERLGDGRTYLTGDRITLGDLALCASAAPLLQPQGYGAAMPPPERMPEMVARVVRDLRARPAADFVQRVYRNGLEEKRP